MEVTLKDAPESEDSEELLLTLFLLALADEEDGLLFGC